MHTPPVPNHATRSEYVLYVGTYGEGIYAFRFHTSSGKLEAMGLKGEIKSPSFLAADPKHQHLYAVSEVDGDNEGAVGSFQIDRHTGDLKKLNTQGSGGLAPCHLAVDHTGKMLLVANYTSGGVSAFPIAADGSLEPHSSLMKAEGSSVNQQRQSGPHAHEVVIAPGNRFAYTPDLGLDQIRIYEMDTKSGTLKEHPPLHVEPGIGPRHMAFSSNGAYAYVLSELKTLVSVYKKTGDNYEHLQTANSLPGDQHAVGGAEILLDHSGRFLYTSNRDVTNEGSGSVSVFAVDSATGKIKQIQNVPTAGRMPRGVEFDPSGHFLLVGDQKGNEIQVFGVSADGHLTASDARYEAPSPVSFVFVPLS